MRRLAVDAVAKAGERAAVALEQIVVDRAGAAAAGHIGADHIAAEQIVADVEAGHLLGEDGRIVCLRR